MSQYIVFNILPSPIHAAKAIRHKSSPRLSFHPSPSSNEHNAVPSFSQSNVASPARCINYNPSTRTITVSCTSPARLTDIDNKIHDSSILAKQFPNGIWFLNSNLVIAKGATFHIDSIDTKWLRISSKVTRSSIDGRQQWQQYSSCILD